MPGKILTINAGSSSIKFTVYKEDTLTRELYGRIERIWSPGTILTFNAGDKKEDTKMNLPLNQSALNFFIDWLEKKIDFSSVKAIGHRVVHGMKHSQPEPVTESLLKELYGIIQYDPDHLPLEIDLIEAFNRRFPQLLQVCCFDTAFHTTIPRLARLFPIPRRFSELGIERYGFHGLSYSYLLEELKHLAGSGIANERVILAHLGNGASLAAVRDGQCVDTTMGFTPAGGLPMGSRSGDLDPGVWEYIIKTESLNPQQFSDLINKQSGLLGISETSADMRDLLKIENEDIRASEAIALFCYQVKKWIGAYAAVLNGLDTLVFAGGIGENEPVIRQRICNELQYLCIELEQKQNETNAAVISTRNSRVTVCVIRTDEEQMIAKSVSNILKSAQWK